MSAKNERPHHLPPRHFNQLDIPTTNLKPTSWYRLHDANLAPIYFSREGRFSPNDGKFAMLYLGSNQETCLLEKFGDEIYSARHTSNLVCLPLSIWNSRQISKMTLPKLRVCDLSKKQVLTAIGADLSSLMAANFETPHTWANAIMQHPNGFDAIKYISRFTKSPCLALFNKPALIQQITTIPIGLLTELSAADKLLNQFSIALL